MLAVDTTRSENRRYAQQWHPTVLMSRLLPSHASGVVTLPFVVGAPPVRGVGRRFHAWLSWIDGVALDMVKAPEFVAKSGTRLVGAKL